MKHLTLILGLGVFVFFAVAGIMAASAYFEHKENEKLKRSGYDFEDVEL